MTEFTEKDLQKFQHIMVEEGVDVVDTYRIITRLRPKPKFADDQVVLRSHSNTYDTYKFSRGAYCRALTIPEMGPLVVNLVDAIADAHAADTPTSIYSAWRELEKIHGESDGNE